ncbi:hypothetical protein [uncultured Caulobacter sp.]|uniref:hypothetical protein n=1 Tax=uncultured Caulobacter sp. TaxID=158749 RepID=UPI00261DC0A7|nr:hypothetical protein [uncultured Caulobacter sp.]
MAGMACLRICIEHGARTVAIDGVTPAKIDKAAAGYIDLRWRAPRRHGRVGPGAYLLIDPVAEALDGEELRQMAAELQRHLFGAQGQQDLCMLTFEGDEEQVLNFTTLPEAELLGMRGGEEPPPQPGRTRIVSQDGVRELAPWGSTPRVVADKPKAEPPAPARLGWRGVYSLPRQRFEASHIQSFLKPGEVEPRTDADFMNRDLLALERAVAALEEAPQLRAWVGVRLWSIARAGLRDACGERFAAISPLVRERLGALVYDAPRDPPFSAIGALRELVRPHFARVGLRVSDPGFYAQALPDALVDRVFLQLPDEDEKARLLKAQRFLSARGQYLGRKLTMGLAGVRAPRELELAARMGAQYVEGPLVSALFAAPVADQAVPLSELPLRA